MTSIRILALGALVAGAIGAQGSLLIEIVEGGGAIHNVAAGKPVAPRVRVTDFAGRPVAFAAVTFTLPESGPGGTVAGGMRVSVATGDNGEATVPALRLNGEVGAWTIHVEASCRGRFARTSIEQINAAPVEVYLARKPGAAIVARR
ncbi:MAG: hypothetical protein R2729_26045 [Bryobacteraceae bacterium]